MKINKKVTETYTMIILIDERNLFTAKNRLPNWVVEFLLRLSAVLTTKNSKK
jgi:hypothetical protein